MFSQHGKDITIADWTHAHQAAAFTSLFLSVFSLAAERHRVIEMGDIPCMIGRLKKKIEKKSVKRRRARGWLQWGAPDVTMAALERH